METQRKSKHRKTNPTTIVASSSDQEVSSLEWEEIAMAQEEEDLICRMFKLVGERWDLIAGRIPGRTAEEIERFWVMKNHRRSLLR
ncbi:PREDICTED: MYB-like transcription factor ETC1 isoform X1 [Camelina sativa]|uniref:MYB-like transcription factor ETC1 isoform X1 n=1 Tax=Camelina sativa TaxID=90675 RepID=A0ABM0WQI9_CAMSA|nr:PREDICTED: MYB-like transcription factor ETC1 isoform X1 [Camelina sativa]